MWPRDPLAGSAQGMQDAGEKNNLAPRCCFHEHLSQFKALLSSSWRVAQAGRRKGVPEPELDNHLVEALVEATEQGDLEQTRWLIARGADLERRSSHSHHGTPVTTAVCQGHTEVLKALLRAGAKSNGRSQDGWTPLMFAAQGRRANMIACLLGERADANKADDGGTTALMLAADTGAADSCLELLKGRADANAQDHLGTVLDRAVAKRQFALIDLLREHHAVRSPAKIADLTDALLKAAREDQIDEVHRLILEGADADARDVRGGTHATPLLQAARYDHVEVCRLLIQEEADVNTCSGSTPLIEAATKGYLEVVQILLDRDADVSGAGTQGWTPLMHAAERGHADVCQALLESTADVNEGTPAASSALLVAVSAQQVETCQLLVEAGANLNLLDTEGRTSLDRALLLDLDEIEEILRASGAKRSDEFG